MNISEMSVEMAYYHDNTAIVLSRLRCVEFRGNETRPWLFVYIRNNCNKSSVFYMPLFAAEIEFNCKKKKKEKSMWGHQLPPPHLQSKVLPNTVRECILFMSLKVHARPSAWPRLPNGCSALHHSRASPVIPAWRSLSPKWSRLLWNIQ